MIEVRNVDVWYGNIHALKDISLSVAAGEIVAIIGSNGAGKSTLIKAVSGLVDKRSGAVYFEGREITRTSAEMISRQGMAVVPENRRLFGAMSVLENLQLGAYLRIIRNDRQGVKEDLDYVFHLFPRLEQRKKQGAETLSGGEQQMLAIARALMAKPRAVLMDEPSIGLAPIVVREIFEVIRALKEKGYTVLLIEQNARLALKVSDRAYVLELGKVTLEGPSRDLLKTDRVKELYLSS
jgi:branched-chain amino acid transport system ATP-binding protein